MPTTTYTIHIGDGWLISSDAEWVESMSRLGHRVTAVTEGSEDG